MAYDKISYNIEFNIYYCTFFRCITQCRQMKLKGWPEVQHLLASLLGKTVAVAMKVARISKAIMTNWSVLLLLNSCNSWDILCSCEISSTLTCCNRICIVVELLWKRTIFEIITSFRVVDRHKLNVAIDFTT